VGKLLVGKTPIADARFVTADRVTVPFTSEILMFGPAASDLRDNDPADELIRELPTPVDKADNPTEILSPITEDDSAPVVAIPLSSLEFRIEFVANVLLTSDDEIVKFVGVDAMSVPEPATRDLRATTPGAAADSMELVAEVDIIFNPILILFADDEVEITPDDEIPSNEDSLRIGCTAATLLTIDPPPDEEIVISVGDSTIDVLMPATSVFTPPLLVNKFAPLPVFDTMVPATPLDVKSDLIYSSQTWGSIKK
jgi:hypothetical protein